MTKCKVCYSIDEKKVASMISIATKKGLPISEIAERYFTKGLMQEIDLTAAERYHYQRKSINESLDNVLRLFGLEMKDAGLTDKFQTCLILGQGFLRLKNREYRYGVIELSLFELLNNVKDMDKNLFDIWLSEIAKFGRMKDRYTGKNEKKV